MSWFYLILAGMLEIGWPLGLKLAQQEGYRWHGFAAALACIAGSGYFLMFSSTGMTLVPVCLRIVRSTLPLRSFTRPGFLFILFYAEVFVEENLRYKCKIVSRRSYFDRLT